MAAAVGRNAVCWWMGFVWLRVHDLNLRRLRADYRPCSTLGLKERRWHFF